jgi:hypothetical protein
MISIIFFFSFQEFARIVLPNTAYKAFNAGYCYKSNIVKINFYHLFRLNQDNKSVFICL